MDEITCWTFLSVANRSQSSWERWQEMTRIHGKTGKNDEKRPVPDLLRTFYLANKTMLRESPTSQGLNFNLWKSIGGPVRQFFIVNFWSNLRIGPHNYPYQIYSRKPGQRTDSTTFLVKPQATPAGSLPLQASQWSQPMLSQKRPIHSWMDCNML